jgi:hypothetical protein
MKRLGVYLTLLFSVVITGDCIRWSDPFIMLLCRKEKIGQYRLYQQWMLEDQENIKTKGEHDGSREDF